MKRLLNTLYVTTPGTYLARDGETVLVRVEKETRLRVPLHTLGAIVCFGQVSCSPPLMGVCAKKGVSIAYMSDRGRFLARVEGPVSGNVLLRRQQYRLADDDEYATEIAAAVVTAKIANCRTVLMRAARESADSDAAAQLSDSAKYLSGLFKKLKAAQSVDSVRGIEGDAARTYFSAFDCLIATQKDAFFFNERSRRPPMDNMNALLSFLYALLVTDLRSALEGVGLDPAVGYLHRDRPGRPGLALDLMEEFRPYLADRLALSLVNRKQVAPNGFHKSESGAVHMDESTRKKVLVNYQERKQEEVTHPFLGERVALGLLPHLQALLLARHVRGDLDGYPPFFWK